MLNRLFAWRVSLASFLLIGVSTTPLVAGPKVSFNAESAGIRLVQKTELSGDVVSQLLVSAKGASAVSKLHGTLTGVLFQATATPDDSLRSLPIKLSYNLNGDHDAVLFAMIGKKKLQSDVPAWIWATAARFADHDATAAVSLTDTPRTSNEKKFERRWRARHGSDDRLLWARYHPAVDDTLMGFFLLTADAMVGDPVYMRTMTNGLTDIEKYLHRSPTTDPKRSQRAARTLDTLIGLSAKTGDCAMLNDLNEAFIFTAANGQLRIRGIPNYRFSRENQQGEFTELNQLTAVCRKNRQLFAEINPLVYKTVDDFSRCVAFFNFVKESNPDQLTEFVNDLQPVLDRVPTIDTPIALPLPSR